MFGFCITHILNTGCARIWKKKSVAKRLNSTKCLVFIIEIVCVYCAVRTDFLNILHVNFSPCGLGMAQGVSCMSVTPEAGFPSTWDLQRTQWNWEFFFSPSNLIFPVSIIPTPLHARLHVHVALIRRTNCRSLGNFQKEMLFRKQRNNGQKCTVTFPVQNLKYNAIGSVYDLVVAVNRTAQLNFRRSSW